MHPILFKIPAPWGQLPIYAYGVLLGLSLLLGWQVVMSLGKQLGIGASTLGDVYLTATISGIVGARILYVWTNHEEFTSLGQWFDLRSGGLVAYGGFLGACIGAFVHLRLARASWLDFADCTAPAMAIGLCLTRIGCYLYGCDFGTRLPAGAPHWLARLGSFPRWNDSLGELRGSPAFLYHVSSYGLSSDASYSFPVHPTQLYEAALGIALAALCLRVFQRRSFAGQVFLVWTLGYGIARFVLEYLRDDPERGEAFGFSTSQLISLCVVPIAAIAYNLLRKRAQKNPPIAQREAL
jgi:phosphatidylglycerol:prolipoprotein diacylglycerol transferase